MVQRVSTQCGGVAKRTVEHVMIELVRATLKAGVAVSARLAISQQEQLAESGDDRRPTSDPPAEQTTSRRRSGPRDPGVGTSPSP